MKKLAFCSLQIVMISAVWWASGLAVAGMTPAELEQRLAKGEKITVIDIRSTTLFQKGHIPNAINVPASLVPAKQLPPLGNVVVYDSGLGVDGTTAAVSALNQKRGIQAAELEGGFAAWEASRGTTTRKSGVGDEDLPMISYDDLKKAQSENMVLVDLRKASPQQAQGVSVASTTASPQPMTDLKKAFPKAGAVTDSPFDVPQRRQGEGGQPPLLVLIDNGDGVTAQNMARTLKANGVKRVVILAGGEAILSREGQPGLQRVGTSLEVPSPKK